MGRQLDDSNLTNDETRYDGELPSLELALTRTGLFAGAIYRWTIEKELNARQTEIDDLNKEIKRLQQENDLLRQQTKEYIEDVLSDLDSTGPDHEDDSGR